MFFTFHRVQYSWVMKRSITLETDKYIPRLNNTLVDVIYLILLDDDDDD